MVDKIFSLQLARSDGIHCIENIIARVIRFSSTALTNNPAVARTVELDENYSYVRPVRLLLQVQKAENDAYKLTRSDILVKLRCVFRHCLL